MSVKTIIINLQSWWFRIRYQLYYHIVLVPPSIQRSDHDDTTNIQAAIDAANVEPDFFKEVRKAYESKWYRWILKKPVLRSRAQLQSGDYIVSNTVNLPSSITLKEKRKNRTIISTQDE